MRGEVRGEGGVTIGPRARGGLLLAAFGVYAVLALDGRLYWHDVRYLYATAHYGLGDLFAGQWNPQYGEEIHPLSSGAFYLVKLAWLALLELLWWLRPPAAGGLEVAIALSFLATASSAPLLLWVLRRTGDEDPDAPDWLPVAAAALLLVSPTLPYLGGKLLAETIALPLELGALLAALRAEGRQASGRPAALAVAALLHAVAVSARPNIGVLLPAWFVAAALMTASSSARRHALGLAAGFVAIQAGTHALVFAAAGTGWTGFKGYLKDFAAGSRSPLVSVLGGLAAGGALWVLAAAALAAPRSASVRRHALWLAFSLVPTVAVVGLYQVEARYLVAPLVPLAVLGALGAGRVLVALRARAALAVALALGVVSANALALSVLPFEIDRPAIADLAFGPELDAPGASLLVPWAYSDYHYLRTIAPERPIYFVHVPRVDGHLRPYTPEWKQRLTEWYGDRVLWGPDDLAPLLRAGPVYYLAWGVHPPLETWSARLRSLGFDAAAEFVRGLGGVEHGDQSWVAEAPGLIRTPVRSAAFYRLERISSASER